MALWKCNKIHIRRGMRERLRARIRDKGPLWKPTNTGVLMRKDGTSLGDKFNLEDKDTVLKRHSQSSMKKQSL